MANHSCLLLRSRGQAFAIFTIKKDKAASQIVIDAINSIMALLS